MATYGVLTAGFLAKPLTTIDDEIDSALQGILGASAGTTADGKIPTASMAGQLKALLVDAIAAQWDLQEAVHASLDPNQATGASQDAVGAITGAVRDSARFSSATCTCIGTPLTVLSAGRVATVTATGSRFDSLTDATITALSAWTINTPYAAGNRVTNASRAYQCITAGTSAGAGGPTTTSSNITDNAAHWEYLGEGTGAVDVTFQAESSGAIGALAGTLVTIATPVAGWNRIVNLADASVGNDRETDAAFRARRDEELAAAGNTTVDAIRANILAVNQGSTDPDHAPPLACKVFYNPTDFADADGMPPHSVEVLVQLATGATAATIADVALAVWNSVGAGTTMFGTRSDTITDSEGQPQTVYWSQPVAVPVYVTAVGRYDQAFWPSGSDAIVAQTMLSALLTYTASFAIALDVRISPLIGAIMRGPAQTDTSGAAVVPADPAASPVPGLLEVESIYIDITASPVSTIQIPITRRQIATFDSSRCVFTATSETP